MEIMMLKVLEITKDDVRKLIPGQPLLSACGELEAEAHLILYEGRVLKNAFGMITPKYVEPTRELNGAEPVNTHRLDNSELSVAIEQTFDLINKSTPMGPEISRVRWHFNALLIERESRL